MNVSAHPSGLPALIGRTPRVLVLGSFPSLISLERREYYANPRNQFWPIVSRIFGMNLTLDYAQRCRELLAHGVALWDVCESASRPGSLDASIDIRSVIPNDLVGLLSGHPSISRIFMNGGKAATLLDRLGLEHSLLANRVILPSSSPAHAAMRIEDKIHQWSAIADLNKPSRRRTAGPRPRKTAGSGLEAIQARTSAPARHPTLIVGVDCATQPENTGLALGHLESDELVISEVTRATRRRGAAQLVREWIQRSRRVLLALDAPLGWPAPLGEALQFHRAGDPIMTHADALFRRMTDQDIEDRLDKRPFEVGANLIARTAWAALGFLDEIGKPNRVSLTWSPDWPSGVRAIEVYPAATRRSLGDSTKGPVGVQWLRERVKLPPPWDSRSAHEADAIVCVIAGAEFLMGRAQAPAKRQLKRAKQEGWIWVGPKLQ